MEINRGFKFVKLKIKCRYIHYKRQGFAALSFARIQLFTLPAENKKSPSSISGGMDCD